MTTKCFSMTILTLLMSAMILCGCQKRDKPQNTSKVLSDPALSIVCTTFPQYDWVRQILGGNEANVNLTLILSNGTDLHNYQATVQDIVKISTCDLFIYVGGESEKWVDAALKDAVNPNMIVIDLLAALGEAAKAEEIIEGMDEEHDDADDEALDEHVWLSLKNAKTLCSVIEGALSSLDADNAETYKHNSAAYIDRLTALDKEYQEAVEAASVKTLLFGDRFPFRYLFSDYGLNYYAAFPGCSAETEASFETIVFLADKVNDLGLRTVMVTESSDQSIAKTIISNTKHKNQQIIILDSIQSLAYSDIQNGTTYILIMKNNLDALKEALK